MDARVFPVFLGVALEEAQRWELLPMVEVIQDTLSSFLL